MGKEEIKQMHLRLPVSLYDDLKQASETTGQSIHGVILDRLAVTSPQTHSSDLFLRAARVNYSNAAISMATLSSTAISDQPVIPLGDLATEVMSSAYEDAIALLSQSQEPQEGEDEQVK